MTPLSFKKNSWHSLLYRSTYGQYSLPDNICEYFWLLLVAIIIAPLAVFGHLLNMLNENKRTRFFGLENQAVWSILLPISDFLLGIAATKGRAASWNKHHGFWWIMLMGFVIILLIVASIAALFLACHAFECITRKIKTKKPGTKWPVESTPNPLIEGFKAFKGRYCKKINWIPIIGLFIAINFSGCYQPSTQEVKYNKSLDSQRVANEVIIKDASKKLKGLDLNITPCGNPSKERNDALIHYK